jgi:hypothetical protein
LSFKIYSMTMEIENIIPMKTKRTCSKKKKKKKRNFKFIKLKPRNKINYQILNNFLQMETA